MRVRDANWTADELLQQIDEWVIDLPYEHPDVVDWAAQYRLNGRTPWHYYNRLDTRERLRKLHARLRSVLLDGAGVALVKTRLASADPARLIEVCLGHGLGVNVTRPTNGATRPLYAVLPSRSSKEGVSCYPSVALHTDGAGGEATVDFVGLLTVRVPLAGGLVRLASASNVYRNLSTLSQHRLEALVPRAGSIEPSTNIALRRVFERAMLGARERTLLSYDPHKVRAGVLLAHSPNSKSLSAATRELDDVLDASAATFATDPGDLLLIDNRAIAHGWTAYTNDASPARGRLLEQLWVETHVDDVSTRPGRCAVSEDFADGLRRGA